MTGLSSSDLAELSRLLYSPVTLALYVSASLVSFYGLTATVGGGDVARGRIAKRAGWILAWLGVATHMAHEVVRGLAQSRLPLGNMFEVTSLMALVGVAGGLVHLRRRGRDELTGFVMLGGTLVLGLALLMYAEPGPLMPILDTWWRTFHVSLLVGAMGVFAAGFVFTGLHLLRDTGVPQGSTVGAGVAAGVGAGASGASGAPVAATEEGGSSVALRGHVDDVVRAGDGSSDTPADPAWRAQVRGRISPVRLAAGTFLGTSLVSWVWAVSVEPTSDGVRRMLTVNVIMVAAALLAWWLTPYLPDAAVLDGIAHRIIAFAFVLWTVGTIAGAMWAEQSWGRFWGWDPKETGAFLTWVAYAGYLHARATRGVRGRRAAWIGIGAFITLMATYLVANYVIVGLHSYAGL